MQSPGPNTALPPLWLAVLGASMAGALGWGIRGQYGHETGAMIAGVLVGLVLSLLFLPHASPLAAVRAAALLTIGISFGGSMTYGQTVGLTHDPELVGNRAAWAWGMLGLGLKGGLWIGLGAFFFGIGLTRVRYRADQVILLLWIMILLWFFGQWALNQPFDPSRRLLPRLYFSDAWRWQPGADLKPRMERWGGLLAGWSAALIYSGWIRRDRLTVSIALWGFAAGAIGFPAGQCLQSYHAWHLEAFHNGAWAGIDPLINWWNCMETTFGAVWGGTLALGVWLHGRRIGPAEPIPSLASRSEWALLAIHTAALLIWNFASWDHFDQFADLALTMGLIPIAGILGGRLWPYAMVLPITLLPIALKTVRELVPANSPMGTVTFLWIAYAAVPVTLFTAAALWYSRVPASKRAPSAPILRKALMLTVWTYFLLNNAFFRNPLPWQTWTLRTLNGMVFALCSLGLTMIVILRNPGAPAGAGATQPLSTDMVSERGQSTTVSEAEDLAPRRRQAPENPGSDQPSFKL